MSNGIKVKVINGVIIQENGIIRDSSGLLIARLTSDVDFQSIEGASKADRNVTSDMKLTKTRGHHCWWLNMGGEAAANFDNESDVDYLVGLQDRQSEDIKSLKAELDRQMYFSCKTCGGAGSVGAAPDDYYDCPECVDRNNKIDSETVMRFASMIKKAYLEGSVSGALTVYDVYQSARNHVKDVYKSDSAAWDGDSAVEAKGSSNATK